MVGGSADRQSGDMTYTTTSAHTHTSRPPLQRVGGPIAGVAGGLARHFGIDETAMRLLLAVGLLVTGPVVLTAYLVAWVLLPVDPTVPESERTGRFGPILLGFIALFFGFGVLMDILSAVSGAWLVLGAAAIWWLWHKNRR